MKNYFVEGLFLTPQGLKRSQKRGRVEPADIEPFAKSFWAQSPEEALRLASEAIAGGQWVEGPRVARSSEEQRMRKLGAPQLPGFEPPKKK